MTETARPDHDVVIVGAGFGGLGAAIEFKSLGFENIAILEREQDLGGTWHVNHYPGLAVDIASVTYSYSFEPNPYWSRLFAPGVELKRYAHHVADSYDLKRHMQFDTTVTRAEWDEPTDSGGSPRATVRRERAAIWSLPRGSSPNRTRLTFRVSTRSAERSSTPLPGRMATTSPVSGRRSWAPAPPRSS